jgi:hypothetical protein
MALAGVATGLLIRFQVVTVETNPLLIWAFLGIVGLAFLWLYWLAMRSISGENVSFIGLIKGLATESVLILAAVVGLFYVLQALGAVVQMFPA